MTTGFTGIGAPQTPPIPEPTLPHSNPRNDNPGPPLSNRQIPRRGTTPNMTNRDEGADA